MVLTDLHLVMIGILAGLLTQAFKVWRGKSGAGLPAWARDGFIFVASLGLSFFVGSSVVWPVFPPWAGDLMPYILALIDYAAALVVMVGQVVGPAHVVYLAMKKAVYDKIDALKS